MTYSRLRAACRRHAVCSSIDLAVQMALALRSGLHYRRFDAEYVFFDLAADRYFLLSGVAANRFGRFVSGRASAADHEHLLASDILAEGSGRAMRDGCIDRKSTRLNSSH